MREDSMPTVISPTIKIGTSEFGGKHIGVRGRGLEYD